MKAEDYLARLQAQLKGFTPEEKTDILDEIASHIESGEEDPHLGDEGEREQRVVAEMGSPEQMGRGLRGLYRPNRVVDLLWILGPYFVLDSLAKQMFYLTGQYLEARLLIGLSVLLALVGWKRRSVPLMVFWITDAICLLASVMISQNRWNPGVETVPGTVWQGLIDFAALAALLIWLVRLLQQSHFDLLLVELALLPIVLTGANYVTSRLLLQLDTVSRDEILQTPVFIAVYLAWAVGMALFILSKQRNLRWIGLTLASTSYGFPSLLYQQIPAAFGGMMVLIITGWLLDLRPRPRILD